MRVAIVHDYLVNRGGAERVVAAMCRIWPDAPIYTSLYHPEATYDEFRAVDVRVSPLQKRSRDPERFRRLLPLFPSAFASFDLHGYDVVISSSSGFAHHVRVPRGTCHVVYAYSPPRFLWDEGYDLAGVAPRAAGPAIALLRRWLRRKDKHAVARAHFYLAVSNVAAKRLQRVYGRSSTVVYPPVDVRSFSVASMPPASAPCLMVGRMLPYRNQELGIRAFNELQRPLTVVGDGPARAALEAVAGPTIEFTGVVSDEELRRLYARSRALIVPGAEDFGLTPLEANASGRPAIALGMAGALETVIDGKTGVLFKRPDVTSLVNAVLRAETIAFDPRSMRAHAERFSEEAFAASLQRFLEHAVPSCLECARARRTAADGRRSSPGSEV